MTLQQIRDAESFDSLKPAIQFLCMHMHGMTMGEFQAYRRTLESQCAKLGVDLDLMNRYAEDYQLFGYERD